MLNVRLVGSYISKLRKEKGLTQNDLANELNVSHQAVSKWERGESLPDMGTLLALASFFEVTTDSILSGGKKSEKRLERFMEEVHNKQEEVAATYINEGSIKIDELLEIAPLMEEKSFSTLVKVLEDTTYKVDDLVQFAPFIDEDALVNLLQKVKIEEVTDKQLSHLAPFIQEESFYTIMSKRRGKALDFSTIKDIVEMMRIAPFYWEDLEKHVMNMPVENIQWNELLQLAPFMEERVLLKRAKEMNEGVLTIQQLANIAPFIGDLLEEYININVHTLTVEELMSLAPFLDSQIIEKLLEKIDFPSIEHHHIGFLANFLEEDMVKKLLTKININ
ncbi:helix-turn-helix domain-containing protein [Priestia taiwanensis]|uniref:HTH cro/C1-type domain-containing protein n=1 Tax=Priestia taiwanensis TaxID=1347902 RepID=A0A917EL25_9BACI|nr:helix-turn-helix domain-containing protein [Priestia taiwanensis]MBM7362036.1 transcriptional regulator with XRE-family HTH domain [Priestia taiwanensis]GGE58949.1 hypothetical protein GCM10007140_06610 [Priestia taiwanensis]